MNEENIYRLRFGEVRHWVEELLPDHTRPQRMGLALLIWCILTAQSLVLAHLARAFPPEEAGRYGNDETAHQHMQKRLGRILGWGALGVARVGRPLARWAIGLAVQAALREGTAIQAADGRWLLPLLIDYTSVEERFMILQAAAFWSGRGVPVWMKAFCYEDFGKAGQPGSQNQLEEQFLDELLAALPDLPEGWSYVLVFDRGFPRQPLLGKLEEYRREHRLHPEWAVRLPAGWKVAAKGQARWVREYRVGWGQRGWWAGVQAGGTSPVRANLLVAWEAGPLGKVPKEPWRVLTSLPEADATFAVYYSRMLVEEFFRDDKYWLDLEKSGIGRDWRGGKEQVRLSPFRLERLLVGLQGAYLAWATLGEEPQVQAVAGRLRRSRTAQERQAKRPPRLSRISLALLALRYPWHVPEQAFLQAWERLRALLTWAGQGTSPVPVRAPPDREKPPLFLTHPRLAMIYHEELLSVKCPGGPPGF